MAQNKSYKELMELQGATGGTSQDKANAMLALIEGRGAFNYDPRTDPAAQAARKTAARNSRTAIQDTMGQYAGLTGGMPSTAAVSAATQAGNQQLAAGADRVAELEQLARTAYNQETSNMYNHYAALQGAADSEYNRQKTEEQQQYERAQAEAALAREQEQQEYNRKWNEAQLRAQYGDYSGLKALGIDVNVNAGGGGSIYRRGSGLGTGSVSGEDRGAGVGGGLSDEAFNSLLMSYPGRQIPQSEWAALAAQYGESTLIAAGFSKKATQQTQTGSSSGGSKTAGRKPNLPQDPRKGLGGTGMGTRD